MRVLAGLTATLLLAVGRSDAQAVGNAVQTNTYTSLTQGAPAVSSAPAGNFVVVWESFGQDGDYTGVFGRRYAADGTPGSEFPATAFTEGPQSAPDVSVGGDGSFVVVWQGYGPGSDYSDVFARRFANTGAAQGNEVQVNEPVDGSFEGAPKVAATSSGFVVVWDDYEDVFARRFDTAGAPLGDPFQVNTATLGFQGSADVAATVDGGFVVAWEDGYFDAPGEDGSGYGVFARRYDAAGNASGMQFQVNTTTFGDQYFVSVTAPPSGGFIVVWQSFVGPDFDPEVVPTPVEDAAIYGQRFDAGGATMGAEFRANAAPSDEADHPHVAGDQFGNFVVVWSAPNALGASTTVMERRFEGAGTPLAGPTPVNVLPTPAPTGMSALQGLPVVSAASDGRYVVAWQRENGDVSEAAVFAQRFAAIDQTPQPTATFTRTPLPTVTSTGTASTTRTPTATATATRTTTRTVTATTTSTPTRTGTGTATATRSATPTNTATATATTTATTTLPPTNTRTPAPTETVLPSQTPPPGATRTATATATRTPVPTTATEVEATQTPTAAPCASDCNGDGVVAINELVTAVGIALDDRAPGACPAIDVTGDGHVTIEELIRAVANALNGC